MNNMLLVLADHQRDYYCMQDITVDYLNLSFIQCQIIVGLTTKNFYMFKDESRHIYYNFHFKNFLENNLKVSQDLTLLLNLILMVRESKTEIVASEIR